MANRIVYAICSDDCKFETMTKEDILAAIQQAIEQGYVSEPGEAVFSKIKEINANGTAQIWVGTEAEFNALNIAQNIHKSVVRVGTDGVLYLCTDDTSINDVTPIEGGGTNATSAAKARETLGITPANIGAAEAGHGHKVTEIEGAFPAADYDGLIVKRGNPVQAELKAGRGITAVATLEPKQSGSGEPSPDNIRPFIGYDKLDLNHAGKNLFSGIENVIIQNAPTIATVTQNENVVTFSTQNYGDGFFFGHGSFKKGKKYTVSGSLTGSVNVRTYDVTNVNAPTGYITPDADGYFFHTFTASSDDDAVRIWVVQDVECVLTDFQIEAGENLTPYAPYQGKLHTVQIGQTVYGFRYDWLTGKGLIEWTLTIVDDTVPVFLWGPAGSAVIDMGGLVADKAAIKCSHFKTLIESGGYGNTVVGITNNFAYNQIGFSNPAFKTLDDWNAFFAAQKAAGTPVQIVRKLATPVEIQLDGVELIESLEGVNTVYGDGDLEVTFNHDNIQVGHTHPDFVYSAEETDTGKVWIDGKPIYRQIFTVHESFGSSSGIGSSELGTISDLDVPINVYGAFGYVFGGSISRWMAVGMRVSSGDLWTGIEIGGKGLVRAYSSGSSVDAGYVVVEYTKKTE